MNPIKKFVYYTLQVVLGIPCAIYDVLLTNDRNVCLDKISPILDWFTKNE